MFDLEKNRIDGLSDAALINHWIEKLCAEQGGETFFLDRDAMQLMNRSF